MGAEEKKFEISVEELKEVSGGRLPSISQEYKKHYDPNCGIPFEEWFWQEFEKDYPSGNPIKAVPNFL